MKLHFCLKKKSLCLSKINMAIFTDEMIRCLGFASNKEEVGTETDKTRLAIENYSSWLMDIWEFIMFVYLFLCMFEIFHNVEINKNSITKIRA